MKRLYFLIGMVFCFFISNAQVANHVVISEVYGGGGNTGATYKNDFIELYNPTSSPVNLSGWSVQYISASGTGTWSVTNLSGTIPAHGFFLIQEDQGSGGSTNLPNPDATGTISMGAKGFKVALLNTTTALSGCTLGAQVIDFVGASSSASCFEGTGYVPAPNNTASIVRKATGTSTAASLASGGADETLGNGWDSNNNNSDFVVTTSVNQINPQNSSSPPETPPANLATATAASNAAEPSTNGSFTINLNAPAPAGGVTVAYSFYGTASYGTDFSDNGNNGTITIPEGSTSGTITINPVDDTRPEPTEIITINLTSGNNGFAASTTAATINLTDNESSTLYSYNFATCTGSLSDGFTHQSVTGAQVWSCTTFGKIGNAVEMNGYSSGNQTNEDWLISPAIDLSSSTVPLLTFYSKTKFAGDQLRLFVTTNYTGDVTTTSWTELDGRFPAANSDTWTLSENINLSAFKQANVRFAFKYTSSTDAASRIDVDEINVLNTSSAPAPALSINGAMLDFREVNSGNISSAKTFTFWANDLSTDLTVTVPAGFELSKDNSTFGSSISYTPAETQNQQQTVYVRYVPTSANSTSFGLLQLASTSINQQKIFVKGNSYPLANTLNIVNLNLNWFGGTLGPADNDLQQTNAKTVMDYLGADLYAIQEIVDTVRFGNLARSLAGGYSYVVSDFTSSAVDKTDPDFQSNYSSGQKLGLIYKTSLVNNIAARGLLKTTNTSASAYTNWSSGRFPFLVTFSATKNGETKNLNLIILHAKSGSTQSDYDRRKAGVKEMKDTLDAFFSNKQVIVLGDFNDDLTGSIYTGATVSSFDDLIKDSTDADSYKSATLPLSAAGLHSTAGNPSIIDHAVVSNEVASYYIDYSATLFDDIQTLTGIANYATTTTDHYPVLTRYAFEVTAGPLPVKLISFHAVKDKSQVKLTWSTAEEVNAKEFVVERSTDGRNYSSIGKVAARGNTSSVSHYSLNDASPNTGVNFYRLKMVDIDAREEYSKVVKIDFSKLYTIAISPNPAQSYFTIAVSNLFEPMTLEITDVNGRIVQTQTISSQNNRIAVNNLAKGLYFIKLKNTTASYTEKLVIE